jgi:hypothetical protein
MVELRIDAEGSKEYRDQQRLKGVLGIQQFLNQAALF